MSFHPNDIVRRGRAASLIVVGALLFLAGGFFRSQVLNHQKYALQSETNRLRELPLPAPRGVIYDRNNKVIADNVIGYSVSVLAQKEDSLRAVLQRLSGTINITAPQIEQSVRRYRRAPNRPTVIIPDASFDVVSVLEEHRSQFPGLIIQSAPRRFYPDGPVVAPFVGYTGEVSEAELTQAAFTEYKAGQQVGKQGLEKEYESVLRGKEGSQFVEVDARGRVVKNAGARQDLIPVAAPPLYTNIDMELQRFVAGIFGDSLIGGAVAIDPNTGGVLALYSAPSWDANRFIGGIPAQYWDSLRLDPRRPLYNKALQGTYPPGSTWKLATTVLGLETGAARMNEKQPIPCTGGMQYGSRYFRCWDKRGHGFLDLKGAIAKSCDVYFYQLGLKLGLARLVAGGVDLGFQSRAGIDLPEEKRARFPTGTEYFDRKYGKNKWTRSLVLSMAIGQGDNSQTILNMAKFYSALATDGKAARPQIMRGKPDRTQILKLSADQMNQIREALVGVVTSGTAAQSAIKGVQLAGKTGTAQSGKVVEGKEQNHAWFVGFAPAEKPSIVVAVMIEFGGHGTRAAAIASKIIQKYLHVVPVVDLSVEG
ncbi:MAG: penicillin-binding protein 2 [Gemmatimonadaceae bacterium]|nr:penicillin-binding protein 2 [Gemmatimonadaceae bacterium]